MSYVDAIRNEMEAGLNKSEDALDELEQRGPDIIRDFVDNYSPGPVPSWAIPGAVKDKIADLLIKSLMEGIEYARKGIAAQRVMVRYLGSPDGLRAAAEILNGQVNKASGDLAIEVREEALQGMRPSNWSGDAQYEYSRGFKGQNEAVARINDFGSALEDVLRGMADTIETFYIELAIAVAGFVVAILSLVAAILTSPTGIGTILSLIAAVVSVLVAIGAAALAAQTQHQNKENAIAALEPVLAPWPKTQFSI